jgi:hypothetical protein
LAVYGPPQIRHAYGFDQLPYDGAGQTIAIVDAYDNWSLSDDLKAFDQRYTLPDPDFKIVQLNGPPLGSSISWGLEEDLDVQWAHAIAPGASILLVEARTSSFTDMLNAVAYAAQQPGVVAVSMSWGSTEFVNEVLSDSSFTTPPGHTGGSGLSGGITFVAATGDSGGVVEWPAASPNVLSVGGTTLSLDDDGNVVSPEVGWWQGGGGPSSYEAQPAYQALFQTTYTVRTTPDVAYNADLATAYWVYDYSGYQGQQAVYGTSAGAPQWAGLIALADQGLALNNIGSLDGATQTIPALYSLASSSYSTYFYDIVAGNNGYQAGPGYDLVTGLGTPIASQIVPALINSIPPPPGGGGARGPETPGRQMPSVTNMKQPAASPGTSLTMHSNSLGQPAGLLLVGLVSLASGTVPGFPGTTPSSTAIVHAGTDGTSAAFLVHPALATPSRTAEGRIESGGGDNAQLVDDFEDDGCEGRISRLPSDSTTGAGSVTATPLVLDKTAATAPWQQFADACFAADESAGGYDACSAAPWNATESVSAPPDPAAATAVLAIALGGYWSRAARKAGTARQLGPSRKARAEKTTPCGVNNT